MTTRAKSRTVGVTLLLEEEEEEEEEVEEGLEGEVDAGEGVPADGESRMMPLEVAAAALAVGVAVEGVSEAVLGMMVDTIRRARVAWT